jgi:hypothetical protein
MNEKKRRAAFFAGRAIGRNEVTARGRTRTMKRLKPEARKLIVEQFVNRWYKTFTCTYGAWNTSKLFKEIIKELKLRLNRKAD